MACRVVQIQSSLRKTPVQCCSSRNKRNETRPVDISLQRRKRAASSRCLQHVNRRTAFFTSLAMWPIFVRQTKAATDPNEGVTIYIDLDTDTRLSPAERQVLINNLKIQRQNRVPEGFPSFVREGFDIKVLAKGFTQDETGLIYKDYIIGSGASPQDGQQVVFEYEGFNESGARIDSTYNKGYPAETRLGVEGLIPGFEIALKGMKVGGQRRVIIPPELGPPVGPATFFSAKQCEVFDVELVDIRFCRQTQFAMFSKVVCE